MSDERRNEGSGAAIAVVAVLVLLGVGVLLVGGAAVFLMKRGAVQQEFIIQQRLEVEMLNAEMQAKAAELQAKNALQAASTAAPASVPAPAPEIVLEIDAAGDFKLAGKLMSFEELKELLLTEHIEKGPELQVVITAVPETRFDRVLKAVEAAECASITKYRLKAPPVVPAP